MFNIKCEPSAVHVYEGMFSGHDDDDDDDVLVIDIDEDSCQEIRARKPIYGLPVLSLECGNPYMGTHC
jgi:hypothetical protein